MVQLQLSVPDSLTLGVSSGVTDDVVLLGSQFPQEEVMHIVRNLRACTGHAEKTNETIVRMLQGKLETFLDH